MMIIPDCFIGINGDGKGRYFLAHQQYFCLPPIYKNVFLLFLYEQIHQPDHLWPHTGHIHPGKS